MSPVEPSPLVIGTMALPSTEGMDGLAVFPAARSPAGANRLPLTAPSADRKERRFQADFKFMRDSLSMPCTELLAGWRCGWDRRVDDKSAADDFNQRITGNPFESHAGAGRSLPRAEVGPIDL